jgi:dCTP deaminase
MLGYDDLKAALAESDLDQRLVVTPLLDEKQVGPGSIDLRLGTQFLAPAPSTAPVSQPYSDARGEESVTPFGRERYIQPGEFLLGATFEFVGMPCHLMGQVLNRSSWARQGLMVATAVVVQPGYGGCLTLELVNVGNRALPIRTGARIAQLVIWKLETPTSRGYSEKYVAPLGPEPSRLKAEEPEQRRLERVAQRLTFRLGSPSSP